MTPQEHTAQLARLKKVKAMQGKARPSFNAVVQNFLIEFF
jgi:hypothetical protein